MTNKPTTLSEAIDALETVGAEIEEVTSKTAVNKVNKGIVVSGQITDKSGHTSFTGSVDEAVQTIIEQVKKFNKWVFIGKDFHEFNADFTPADQKSLREKLSNTPSFTVAHQLVGGASTGVKVKGIITKTPISVAAPSKFASQIGVALSKKGGKDTITVYISDYNGKRAELEKHKEAIIAAIYNGLTVKG